MVHAIGNGMGSNQSIGGEWATQAYQIAIAATRYFTRIHQVKGLLAHVQISKALVRPGGGINALFPYIARTK